MSDPDDVAVEPPGLHGQKAGRRVRLAVHLLWHDHGTMEHLDPKAQRVELVDVYATREDAMAEAERRALGSADPDVNPPHPDSSGAWIVSWPEGDERFYVERREVRR